MFDNLRMGRAKDERDAGTFVSRCLCYGWAEVNVSSGVDTE